MRFALMLTLFVGLAGSVSAQTPYLQADYSVKVIIAGDTLAAPWTGGYNSVIPVEMEFNGDGLMDLFLFDRVGNRITTFVNNGSTGTKAYTFAPEFNASLPPLHDWVRSVDYDCDGDMDLFSYTSSAMGVWQNTGNSGSGPQFVNATSAVLSWYGSFQNPIFVSQVNMPALTDVDGDGDLDVVTFANSSNYLEYHKNFAMDSLGTCNGFKFYLQPYCWGYFKLSGLSNIGILNQNCRSGIANEDENSAAKNSRHSGSVLTPLDQGCDGDVDLLNGDLLGENMLFLENGGTPDSAYIISQDSAFPVYDVQVQMQNLPAAYYMDLDNDSHKDMLVAPFATVGEDYYNIHFYRNTTDNCSNVFDFVTNRYITEASIDVGTASTVSFYDVDKDGLKDIIAGNDLYYNPNQTIAYSRLAYFRNTGSAGTPVFELITDDWQGLSGITQTALYPAFGDLDGDGDDDMLLGNADGTLIFYQNTAGAGNPSVYAFAAPAYQGIDIGSNSMPQIIDVNRDGKVDLLVGERTGVVNYYENTGTSASPVFTMITQNFGGINVMPTGGIAGYSSPVLFDRGSGYEMLVGSDRGQIFHYTNIDGNLNGTFTLADTMFQNIQELKRTTISVADIDNDNKIDLLTGCLAGGMRLYTQRLTSSVAESGVLPKISLIPNPTTGLVRINMSKDESQKSLQIVVSQLDGRELFRSIYQNGMQLDIGRFPSGMYVVTVTDGHLQTVQKLAKQ